MYYGKILATTFIIAGLTGCAVTHPSSASEKPRAADMPPQVVASSNVKTSATDVKASYSTTVGSGAMTETSVSVATPTAAESVPRIPNASEVSAVVPETTHTTVTAAATATHQTATPQKKTSTHSLAGGFSVTMAYEKAWSKTAKILPSAGYPVMEKDELTGTYYVLDKMSSGGKIERDTPIYQVRLTKSGEENTHVILLNSNSQPVASDVANRILGTLKNKLI